VRSPRAARGGGKIGTIMNILKEKIDFFAQRILNFCVKRKQIQ